MAIFTGTGADDIANADTQQIVGFSAGTADDLALLIDNIGDTFLGGNNEDLVVAGSGNDIIEGGIQSDDLSGGEGDVTISAAT